ncbi:putative cytochrome P450 [Streptomyces albus]|uniref:Putative cytochrome P450 n=1 Tax=Streptomyces albus (strain ATCC 21838 / DSM 41398 / FERM P-419 / JCM 4703 / NBRC 107858) TaxID=1081613 RepID=A0A0B5EXF3_STRA4|nr:putative cytochrome P450 [Streptomyces albus]AOU81802.1 putative cytochrome P450 [Streptomyces albus]AYN37488.1 cytochrome P450 [Streptomyces albus]
MPEQQPLVLDPTGSNHHAEDDALRARGPATLVDILGVTVWSVSDPTLLTYLLSSAEVSKDPRHWPAGGQVAPTWPLALWITVDNMSTADEINHWRLRRPLAPTFGAHRVQAMAPAVENIVTTLLDALDAVPPGTTADLRAHLAAPLPLAVISQLMGIGERQRSAFALVVDGLVDTTLTPTQTKAATARLYELLDELIAAKRREPGHDMTSQLLATRDNDGGRALVGDEVRDTLLLMISAGYAPTVNAIDQAITALLTDPTQLAVLQRGDADWGDVVEETLRHEPPIRHLPLRYVLADIPLPDGQTIRTGEAILASYSAAGRHPDWHGDSADRFDATRKAKDHLAFGHGVHFCLGAPLARLEVATALRMLFDRFPHLELAVPPIELQPLASLISNGHRALPVRLRPTHT